MEPIGAFYEREWISVSGTYVGEESDFMANLVNNSDLSLEIPSAYWAAAMDEQPYTLTDSHSLWFPNSASLSFHFSMEDAENADSARLDGNGSSRKTRQCWVQHSPADPPAPAAAVGAVVNGKTSQLKRKSEASAEEVATRDEKVALMSVDRNSKKRSQSLPHVEKPKRSGRARKIGKRGLGSCNEEDHMVSPNGECTSSLRCEDDCNEAQEMNGGMTSTSSLISNGKGRASRGSATDPQSLYARKRRERINERLRILQHLVPNGTKVDISTMLEEAVEYVKFLQLQIKLLSSDDLWMYAPIAYNGMDIGLKLKFINHDNASQ